MFHQRPENANRRRGDGNRFGRRLLLRRLPIAVRRYRWGTLAFALIFYCSGSVRLEAQTAEERWTAPPLVAVLPESRTTASSASRPLLVTPEQARRSMQWLAELATTQLPRTIDGDDGWGDKKKIWAGVSIKREGLKLKTHRRFRELRHGRWVRYHLTLPQQTPPPGNRAVDVTVTSTEVAPGGLLRVASAVTVPMQFETRIERWNLGFQWYSIAIRGDLRVRLETEATIGLHADYSVVPPAMTVDPKIQRARLVLERFEVDRISKVGGDFAEGVGEIAEEIIEEIWLKRENEKLVRKLNRKIDGKRDDLRWSMWDFMKGFEDNAP